MGTNPQKSDPVRRLLNKGVRIPCPESVEIGQDVDPERISGQGVIIHSGCRVYGSKTLIMSGVELGYEAPVTVHDCQLGHDVNLKGGFFHESCFLQAVGIGAGAQVRAGCLLEEWSRGGHTVGLKQTILFPFVTLGSLINFCDCLMAGGTDKSNHSEVGSSYIHFNYSPNQDKATASLIGDVSRGVMINQAPIFLGGQGGLVGPVGIEYGSVAAAGTILRKDLTKENMIQLGSASSAKIIPFRRGLYTNIKRLVVKNTLYISNLIALRRWYLNVRTRFTRDDAMEPFLMEGAVTVLEKAIFERLKRLGDVAVMMPQAIEAQKSLPMGRLAQRDIRKKDEFFKKWPDMEQTFSDSLGLEGEASAMDAFLNIVDESISRTGRDYIRVIKGLDNNQACVGTDWLKGLVDEISGHIWKMLPSFKIMG